MSWPLLGDVQRIQVFANYHGETTGTLISGAGALTLGTWTLLVSNTPFDFCGIFVNVIDNDTGANYQLNIGTDSGATPLLEDLYYNFPRANQAGYCTYFPIYISSGTPLYGQAGSTTAAAQLRVYVHGLAASEFLGGESQTTMRVESLGSFTGTNVDPGASANVKGTHRQMGSPDRSCEELVIGVFTNSNTAMATAKWLMDIGFQTRSSPSFEGPILIPNISVASNATADSYGQTYYGPFPIHAHGDITTYLCRAQCTSTDATDRLLKIALYPIVTSRFIPNLE